MKWMIASDLHGSAYYCKKMVEAFEREGADRLFLLGDLLYHGPRNDLPEGYAPKQVMPLLNGMDTAKELRQEHQSVPIIFLTSSREFAVDSYEVKALNYLMKPVDPEKLFAAMDDFTQTLHREKETFTAQTSSGFCRITLDDVDYLEAQNKLVQVCLSNNTTLEIRELFSHCEEIFSLDKGFFKCHRSYIVNLDHVDQFTKTTIHTKNGTQIPISRNNSAAFKEAYFSYMFR